MKVTLLMEINRHLPKHLDDHMIYDIEHNAGFASFTASNIEEARELVGLAIMRLHHLGAHQIEETENVENPTEACMPASDATLPTGSAGKELTDDPIKAYEETARGKRTVSAIKKGVALVDSNSRYDLHLLEIEYLKERLIKDFWSGIGAVYHLGMARGYNMGKKETENKAKKLKENAMTGLYRHHS